MSIIRIVVGFVYGGPAECVATIGLKGGGSSGIVWSSIL